MSSVSNAFIPLPPVAFCAVVAGIHFVNSEFGKEKLESIRTGIQNVVNRLVEGTFGISGTAQEVNAASGLCNRAKQVDAVDKMSQINVESNVILSTQGEEDIQQLKPASDPQVATKKGFFRRVVSAFSRAMTSLFRAIARCFGCSVKKADVEKIPEVCFNLNPGVRKNQDECKGKH